MSLVLRPFLQGTHTNDQHHICLVSLTRVHTHTHTGLTPGPGRKESRVGSGVACNTIPSLQKGPQGPWGPGNLHSCAPVPVQLQGRAFPGKKVTICASSPFPGLGHLQHLQAFRPPSLPPGVGGRLGASPSLGALISHPPNSLHGDHCFRSSV